MKADDYQVVVESPVGPLRLAADAEGNLVSILFTLPEEPAPAITPPEQVPSALVPAVTQLEEYFAGERLSFDLAIALRGSAFQQAAWQALSRIPYGETCSYSAQAALMGRPKAVRAVGGANHHNPLPIVLPCHRVVSADGSLGGFGGGIDRKRWLLAHERDTLATGSVDGVPQDSREPVQLPLMPVPR